MYCEPLAQGVVEYGIIGLVDKVCENDLVAVGQFWGGMDCAEPISEDRHQNDEQDCGRNGNDLPASSCRVIFRGGRMRLGVGVRLGSGDGLDRALYRHHQTVPAPPQRLHKLRLLGRIAQRDAQLFDCRVDGVLEFHDCIVWPKLGANLFSSHDFTRPVGEELQDLERLLLERDLAAAGGEFARSAIELKWAEANYVRILLIRHSVGTWGGPSL